MPGLKRSQKKKSFEKMNGGNKSKSVLKLQIVSDLHLEFRPDDLDFLVPSAPVLCLLGDICVIGTDEDFETYKKFIDTIYDKYEIIIHIPGNHEYYNKTQRGKNTSCTMEKINERMKNYTKTKKKLHFLNNNMLKLQVGAKKFFLIGTAMWTYVDPKDYATIQNAMNDYKYIHVRDKGTVRNFQVEDMQKLHRKAVACTKRFITMGKKAKAKCILLTHHKTFRTKTDTFSQAYESHLEYLYHDPVCLVAYGHTHKAHDGKVNKVRVVSNPRGYPREQTKFNNKFTVNVR
jgi:predicted phosphodiesterase